MKPIRGNVFDEDRAIEAINSAHTALLKIRETQGKWEDANTVGMSEEEWKKGSVVVAEALLCFLIPNAQLPKHFGSIKIKEDYLREDIEALIGFTKAGIYHSLPYLPTEASFTDTASLLLGCFAHIMGPKSVIPDTIKKDYRNEIGDAARSLLKFLRESAATPKKATRAWAPTDISEWVGPGVKRKTPMPLDSNYHTSLVLKGLSDAHSLLALLSDSDRSDIEELMEFGINGIAETYDSSTPLFARNRSNTERNIIFSTFAVEGLLCWSKMLDENEQLKVNLVNCVKNMVEVIGPDLKGLVNYDQNMTHNYAYMVENAPQMTVIVDDRSTIGSLVNVFCGALRYLPPGEEIDRTYAVIDSLVREFYVRRNSKENLWASEGTRIYYTMRMIESLTLCLSHRPEQELNLSERDLARLLANALSSEELIWKITERISKDLGTSL